jgi:ferritin-like metal-binding protein YciE
MSPNRKSSRRQSSKESPDASELLVLELQQIHSAETQLSRALPRLAKTAQSQNLKQMLDQRLEQGERLTEEIDSVFDELEESPGRRKNVAAEGLINDAREHVQEVAPGPALDAVLIASIQKTEHYCIAAWGTARSLAQATQQQAAVKAMERALKEGKTMDEQLTDLAENEITPQLLAGASEGEEEEGDGESRGQGRSRNGSRSERRQST